MSFEDPLDRWLDVHIHRDAMASRQVKTTLTLLRQSLSRLGEVLAEAPRDRRPDYYRGHHGLFGARVFSVVLPPGDRSHVEQLYRQVMQRGGKGGASVQEALLDLLGSSGDAATLPFWNELLTLRRLRDRFANTRRTHALAALALMVLRNGDPAALEVLVGALGHDAVETRAMAAYYLGRACGPDAASPSGSVVEALTEVAATDRAFTPRFMARRALVGLDQALPPEHPGGAYAFKVWHSDDEEVYRVIEVSSRQTLAHLHHAIQDAWGWNEDHLYSFYLNNQLHDPRYEFAHEYTEDAPAYADQAMVGDLSLGRRHRLLYLFDFGDHHVFRVVVAAISPQAAAGTLPRVVEAVGEPMSQYPAFG